MKTEKPLRLIGSAFFRAAVLTLCLVVMLPACAPLSSAFRPDSTPPVIDVWYGSRQEFGKLGLPQKWINVLGSAADPESGMRDVHYSLNGGSAVALALGPDKRRLASPGDFNIEIDISKLVEGENQVSISAVNQRGLSSMAQVTVIFHQRAWPLPYSIDWSKVSNLQDAVQVVDGHWAFDAQGVRPLDVAYDRVLAIGDMNWQDYEVTVAFTLHGIDKRGYTIRESGGAGFGVNLHWQGHTDDPVKCDAPSQPHCGWNPVGSSNWYSFKKDGVDTLAIEAQPPDGATVIKTLKLAFGHSYVFKTRVESSAQGNHYFFKVWEQGQPEPAAWTLERQTVDDVDANPGSGSLLLVLHHVDVTFGSLSVTPVGDLGKARP